MNLEEKIARLVRYCGQHQAHGFMMDERNTDDNFNITLPEEKEIREKISNLKVILLTGEAGDGKSRILRNITPLLEEQHFSDSCQDFSALTEMEKAEMIERLQAVLCGESQERLMILANVGVFTQAVLQFDIGLMEELTREREDVFICNFEKRNLAEDRETFSKIVRQFLACDLQCPHPKCDCKKECVYRENIKKLTSESGLEAMRTICNAVYLTGGHITFRELLSLLSYAVTFGQDCRERRAYVKEGGLQEEKAYYNIFEKNEDILLKKVSCMDPALKRGRADRDEKMFKADYIRARREAFFETQEKPYQMLSVDYLEEFYEVLEHMHRPPYHYDTVQDKDATLQMLKKGINKMNNRGKSDTGLVVTDTPLILGNKIRTEFLVMQDMPMIWHRYDLQLGGSSRPADKLWNKFYLSYFSSNGGDKLISLLIDYRQFCYLMMCSKDYFLNRNELTVEEYAVNTFYRKILQEQNQAYNSLVIRFEEQAEERCDFSLRVHSKKDIFGGGEELSILIKKEN